LEVSLELEGFLTFCFVEERKLDADDLSLPPLEDVPFCLLLIAVSLMLLEPKAHLFLTNSHFV
jgi:hypothetical protein